MRRCLFLVLLTVCSAAGVAMAQDVGASHEGVCCGPTCCFIDGECLSDGNTNPRNECQSCDPSMSQTEWTTMDGCTPRDAGGDPPDTGGGCSVSTGATAAPLLGAGLALVFFALRRRR